MVNNSVYINKTNNHLSPQLAIHSKTNAYDVGNPCPVLWQAHKCGMDAYRKKERKKEIYINKR